PMVRRIAWSLACMGVAAASATSADAGDRRLVRGQVENDAQRGVAYSLAHTSGGGVRLSGRSAELTFDKTSYADGHFELRIESGADVVSFAVGVAGTVVNRGGRTAMLGGAATEQDFERARVVLAGSRAIKQYRR